VLARLAAHARRRSLVLAAMCLAIPSLVVALYPREYIAYTGRVRDEQIRVMLMGRYLREVLPPNAVIFTSLQSTAAAHYTQRPVVRLDAVPPAVLDPSVAEFTRRGYTPVFLVDQQAELPTWASHFHVSGYGRFDWRPRAVFRDRSEIYYLVASELPAARQGARWPIDVLTP
jgi:hypothetical protein